MLDLAMLSDRDLLVTLNTKVDSLIGDSKDHEARLRALEARTEAGAGAAAGRLGFFEVVNKGAGTIWALLATSGMVFLWLR